MRCLQSFFIQRFRSELIKIYLDRIRQLPVLSIHLENELYVSSALRKQNAIAMLPHLTIHYSSSRKLLPGRPAFQSNRQLLSGTGQPYHQFHARFISITAIAKNLNGNSNHDLKTNL